MDTPEVTMKETTTSNDSGKKKMSSRQIAAIIGIVLLVLMYVITLILAIFDNSASGSFFALSLACTFIIPIIVFLYVWMTGRASGKKIMGDPEDQN